MIRCGAIFTIVPTPHVQCWLGGAGRRSGAAFAGARSLLSRQRSRSLSVSALALAVVVLASLVRSRRRRVAARRLDVGAPRPGSARVRSWRSFSRAVSPAARARVRSVVTGATPIGARVVTVPVLALLARSCRGAWPRDTCSPWARPAATWGRDDEAILYAGASDRWDPARLGGRYLVN